MKMQSDRGNAIDIEVINADSNRILAKFIAIGTFSGAIINLIARGMFTNDNMLEIIAYSIFLIILGFMAILLRNLKLNSKLVTHLLSAFLVIIVVITILKFTYNGGITVWSISLLCLITAVTSVNKIAIIYNTSAAIIVEIYLWIMHPNMLAQLDSSDYAARIGIYLAALIICCVVNNMFVERLRKNSKHIEDIEAKNREIITLHEEIYKLVSESTNDGIWSYDLVNNKQIYSQWWSNVLGYDEEELNGMGDWTVLVNKNDLMSVENRYVNYIRRKIDGYEHECRMKTKKGSYLWIKVKIKALFDKSGSPYMVVGAYTDITPLKEKKERLKRLAYYDSLTGLPNRQYFLEKLQASLDAAAEEDKKFYVIFIDLDNFKKVNDTLGHYYGDILLQDVASRFKHVVREPNVLGRLGGDEFAVIVHEFEKAEEVENFVQALMHTLIKPFVLKNNRFLISGSFGISIFPEDGKRVDELLRNADTAMYRAKETGRNNFKLFNRSMETDLLRKVGIENRLLTALDKNEFYLVYQPQFSIGNNIVRGFEALIRWNNDEMGIVQPMDFIPLAEETGYISIIGRWVLKTACLKFRELQRRFNYYGIISVNISPVQFKSAGFVDMIKEILRETDFNPEYLELEITESVFIDSFENAIAIFSELKKLGVKISLDDFGTGYSSLSYLQQLPIDTLKIDKSFVRDINDKGDKKGIVKPIISLVHNMNINVIAEGVETQEQLNYLRNAKCDTIQGYLLGKPRPEVEIYLEAAVDEV